MDEMRMGEFTCPVEGCSKELTRLQVMHFRAKHGCNPIEWVEQHQGSEIEDDYSSGLGSYAIAEKYEWLSSDMVCELVNTRTHRESITGSNNPMKRERIIENFVGEENPAKRPSVRKKLSEAATGRTLSEEAKQKISDKNTGNEVGEEHRKAISKAASTMDRSYMQTEEYSRALSEGLKGREPTYPVPYEVDGLSHKVRFEWEEKIGKLLFREGIPYEYERQFELSTGSYYPDFVTDDVVITVKGWANERSITKAEKFMNEFPSYTYVVVGDEIPCDVHISWENRSKLIEVVGCG